MSLRRLWRALRGTHGAPGPEPAREPEPEPPEAIEQPGSDELDLHTFSPREVGALVDAWLDECAARGLTEVRIVHGKGVGTLRRIVHAALERHPAVAGYRLAPEARGGWGATLVTLRQP